MRSVLDVHEDGVEITISLNHVNTLLAVRGIDHCVPVQSEALCQNRPVDVVVLSIACEAETATHISSTYLNY